MKRHRLAILLIGTVVAAVAASTGAADSDEESPIKIILHPAREPHPALKYQLLPPLLDRRPGNAVVQYLKVPHEQAHLSSDQAFWETLDKWLEMPLPELRKEANGDGRKYAWISGESSSSILEMLDRGARCDSCDWDMPFREHEFYSIVLPEIQSSRSWARILVARARFQIALGRYDDAINTLQTGFALGRHVAQVPTVIQGLVGVAIVGMMSYQVETLIQQPDAPNLYWALASLPRPIVDFRLGYEGEFASIYLSFPELRDLDKKDYPPEQWRRLFQETIGKLAPLMEDSRRGGSMRLFSAAATLEGYPRAKRFLIAKGRSSAEVEAMPVPQVILIYTMQTYDELRDDMFRWLSMPYPEFRTGMKQADKRLKESVANRQEIIPIAATFLPAMQAVKGAETRANQKIAVLEVIEALRLFAADHDGKLPESLKGITDVPVPLDPFRGESFNYVRSGNSAKLESPFPDDPPLRYEIQLTKEGAKP